MFAKLGNGSIRDLTLNTTYTHPTTKQCNYTGAGVSKGTINYTVSQITLPNYSTTDGTFYITDNLDQYITFDNIVKITIPENYLDITIIGSIYSDMSLYYYIIMNGVIGSDSPYITRSTSLGTISALGTGSTFSVKIPKTEVICIPGTPSLTLNGSHSANGTYYVTIETGSKVRWDTFFSIKFRYPTFNISYTKLDL